MQLLRRWLEKPGQTQDAETRGAVELTLLFALVSPLLLIGATLETIQFDDVVIVLTIGFCIIAGVCAYSIRRTFAALRHDRQYLASALADARADAGRARADLKQLREAFDVLPEPLILFDADDRVVIWNKLYAKHSSLAPGHGDGTLRPGLTFTELMRANLVKGRFPAAAGREEEWLAERLALHTNAVNTYEQRLADDQWVRIEERRTPEGGNISVRIDITDLKQREASFRLLFDENPVPMLVFDHKTLQILAVNQTMIDHYGYSREQFLEMSIEDITPPEEFETARASIATLGPRRPHTGKVWRHLKADGSEILIVSYSRGIDYKGYHARFAAIIDVTERVKVDQELRETRAFLEQIIDNVPLAVTVKDVKDQRFVMMNRTAEEYWGVPRNEAIGKTVADLFGEERANQVGARDKAAIAAEGPIYLGDHKRIGRGDQDRIFTSHRVAVRDEEGKPIYVLGVMEDVTERRRAEERIEHLAHFDSLTDLPNRATFTTRLTSTIETAAKAGEAFAVLCPRSRSLQGGQRRVRPLRPATRCCRDVATRLQRCRRRRLCRPSRRRRVHPHCATGAQPARPRLSAERLLSRMLPTDSDRGPAACAAASASGSRSIRATATTRPTLLGQCRRRALSRQGGRPRLHPLLRGRDG